MSEREPEFDQWKATSIYSGVVNPNAVAMLRAAWDAALAAAQRWGRGLEEIATHAEWLANYHNCEAKRDENNAALHHYRAGAYRHMSIFVREFISTPAAAPICQACSRPSSESPGTVHCASKHGRCGVCGNWRAACSCPSSLTAAAPSDPGLLDDIEDYLDRHQDADGDSDGYRGNEEMGLLTRLREWKGAPSEACPKCLDRFTCQMERCGCSCHPPRNEKIEHEIARAWMREKGDPVSSVPLLFDLGFRAARRGQGRARFGADADEG